MNYNFFPERFASHIELGTEIESCWNWKSAQNGFGYGQLTINDKTYLAHRVSYQLYKGYIPEGLQIDHICNNRKCVNPDHLEAVTRKENMRRMNINRKRVTHCTHGHEYTESNTYTPPGTSDKTCITCRKIRSSKLRESYKV